MSKEQWIEAKNRIYELTVDEFIEELKRHCKDEIVKSVDDAVDSLAWDMQADIEASLTDRAYERYRDYYEH